MFIVRLRRVIKILMVVWILGSFFIFWSNGPLDMTSLLIILLPTIGLGIVLYLIKSPG
jgi:hypothetical protein